MNSKLEQDVVKRFTSPTHSIRIDPKQQPPVKSRSIEEELLAYACDPASDYQIDLMQHAAEVICVLRDDLTRARGEMEDEELIGLEDDEPVTVVPSKHTLKSFPSYFDEISSGRKTFDFRNNDRNFRVGDTVILKEWRPSRGYTGRQITKRISYLETFDQTPYGETHVILGYK